MALSSYELTVDSSAPPHVVFDVLADATRWKEWAGATVRVSTWDREGVPPPGGVGAVRTLGRWPLFAREQITEYDPPRHLAYTILSGVPVRGYHADVDVHPHPRGGSTIRWSGSFAPVLPGTGGAFELLFERIIQRYAVAAAREAERRAR